MSTGIYKIYNKETHQYYIGQSLNIESRLNHHKSELRKGTHINDKLQTAFDEYGENCFLFESIYECEPEFLNVMEKYFIEKYEALISGYNKKDVKSIVREESKKEQRIEKLTHELLNMATIDLKVDETTFFDFKLAGEFQRLLNKYLSDNPYDEINIYKISPQIVDALWDIQDYFHQKISGVVNKTIYSKVMNKLKKYKDDHKIIFDDMLSYDVEDKIPSILIGYDNKKCVKEITININLERK